MWILNPKSSIQCFVSFFRFYLKLIKVKREASRRATQLTFRALEKNNNYNNKNKNCVSFFGGDNSHFTALNIPLSKHSD